MSKEEEEYQEVFPPDSSSESSSKQHYRDIALGLVNSAVQRGNNIAQQKPGSRRALAASTATTLLEMGMERFNTNNGRGLPSNLTAEDIQHIASMPDSAEDNESKASSSTNSHFADRLIEKLLKSTLPEDIPEREIFEKRLRDPERNKRPGLSIGTLASNVKKLASKMSNFFALQYALIYVITWKQPTKTLSVLVLYTAACLWPHLIIAYPLIFLLFGVLIPGYVHRHPPRRLDLIKVKKRGQSLLSFFNSTSESSIVEDMVDEDYLKEDAEIASSGYSISDEASEITISSTQVNSSEAKSGTGQREKKETAKHRKSNLDLLINLRDFQNLTSDLIKGMDKGEQFYFETAGFKDERLSTFIFYGVLLATFATLFLGQFIPWRAIFIQSGWVGLILCHPKAKKYLVDMSNTRKARARKAKEDKEAELSQHPESQGSDESQTKSTFIDDLLNDGKKFDRDDIIVDDAPEVRIVEVFQLQIKSILKHDWSFYRYSTTMYDTENKTRTSGKRPQGVEYLSEVLPPHDWKFDMGFVNKWVLDTNPKTFIEERNLKPDLFIVKDNEQEGWIYDNMEGVVHSDIVYEFRRRRLYRECYRYARPHKRPKSD
ncbi:hypothetical protein KGF57_005065 [Candida theae]|uniref:TECPR1-like DysF domain-containing protein n=1 Tax=Candida theae TaxID=1198502 RepID=A0AAD5FWE4_9ASCO|nr:uncharacterized protein KGF57_005065 [Candida theae]KAI5949002.1 hypothetical protein KGF57_005065 [Candida theae]